MRPFNMYNIHTEENVLLWTMQYNYLKQMGVKLKRNPETQEEVLFRQLYSKLRYNKIRNPTQK